MSPKEQSERIEELEGTVNDLQKTVAELQVIIVNVVSSHADYQDALNLHKEYVKAKEIMVDGGVASPDPDPRDFDDHLPDHEADSQTLNLAGHGDDEMPQPKFYSLDEKDGEPELGSHDLSDDQQSLDSVYGEDDHGVERL
ncbi:hypothetical protein [uncultured Mediterranean phage uvMED]|nr:hypothetical protein [uncultured Mediterranean phage uvMED]